MSPFTYTFRPWRMRDGLIVVASERYWKTPCKWRRDAEVAFNAWSYMIAEGTTEAELLARGHETPTSPRVLVDVDPFAIGSPVDHVTRLFHLIDATPNLIWAIRTEHPERVRAAIPRKQDRHDVIVDGRVNVDAWHRDNLWLAATVTSQAEADERIPELLKLRDLCGRLVVDVVPTEEIDLLIETECSEFECGQCGSREVNTEIAVGDGDVSTYECHACGYVGGGEDAEWTPLIDWVAIRGEIGKDARPTNIAHVRSVIRQCRDASVPVWVERLGSKVHDNSGASRCTWPESPEIRFYNDGTAVLLRNRDGADPSEWPEDLRVREVPR